MQSRKEFRQGSFEVWNRRERKSHPVEVGLHKKAKKFGKGNRPVATVA